jgi:type I restriction enzyme S subunit
MISSQSIELLNLFEATINHVNLTSVALSAYRLDASSFLNADTRLSLTAVKSTGQISDLADVFTIYIQTPILYYVEPFDQSRPYLTTSELGEYQRGIPTHVSLITDTRLIEWEVKRGNIVLSRSGRVGEAYWIDKRLDGALVGDSFRVVPKNRDDAYFIYALLASPFARDYMTGVSYGSVVDHASVAQARSLPIPRIKAQSLDHISVLIKSSLDARDVAYDLLDEAEAELLRLNELPEISISTPAHFDPLGQPEFYELNSISITSSNDRGSGYRLDAHFYNLAAQQAITNLRKCKSDIKTIKKVANVFMGPRFKRNYVESAHGVPFLSGKNIVQIRPELKHLSNLQMADMQELIVKRGWSLVTCSGTIGRTCFVWDNYEECAASQHILRIKPIDTEIDPAYLNAFLASRYGYEQILRFRHGSVIDEITDKQIGQVLVPCPARKEQKAIGDMVRKAYELRAEAIRLEDEAQEILKEELQALPEGR